MRGGRTTRMFRFLASRIRREVQNGKDVEIIIASNPSQVGLYRANNPSPQGVYSVILFSTKPETTLKLAGFHLDPDRTKIIVLKNAVWDAESIEQVTAMEDQGVQIEWAS